MKKLLLFILVLGSLASYSQDRGLMIARVPYTHVSGEYVIVYKYNTLMPAFQPATDPPQEIHWPATISVYKKIGKKLQKVGKEWKGIYVRGGCFEDVPEKHIAKALDIENLNP